MTIEAKIIADSISPDGIRLTTFQLRYPRFIHAELMTHRVFSRNASSSRAIPVERMIEDLRRDPAMPIYWGSNKPGMQAGDEIEGGSLTSPKSVCQFSWLNAMEVMIDHARVMIGHGLHKQIANRILEPWAHINVVVTATDWNNFYALRRHEDAQPEIKVLADAMWEEMRLTTPHELQPGEWHLPYVTKEDWSTSHYLAKKNRITRDEPMCDELVKDLKKVSVARCARVSYLTHDGRQTTVEEDLQLYDRLVGSMPLHASPAEHQATPDIIYKVRPDGSKVWNNPRLHGNLNGWIQYRKTLPGEFTPG